MLCVRNDQDPRLSPRKCHADESAGSRQAILPRRTILSAVVLIMKTLNDAVVPVHERLHSAQSRRIAAPYNEGIERALVARADVISRGSLPHIPRCRAGKEE